MGGNGVELGSNVMVGKGVGLAVEEMATIGRVLIRLHEHSTKTKMKDLEKCFIPIRGIVPEGMVGLNTIRYDRK